ncbi:unnamed protein product, partial [Ectocarpus fasciculatus]
AKLNLPSFFSSAPSSLLACVACRVDHSSSVPRLRCPVVCWRFVYGTAARYTCRPTTATPLSPFGTPATCLHGLSTRHVAPPGIVSCLYFCVRPASFGAAFLGWGWVTHRRMYDFFGVR